MLKSKDSNSNCDSSDSSQCILNNAMIKSSESSDVSEFSDYLYNNNNRQCTMYTEYENTIGISNSDFDSDYSRHSIILAGSHKQNESLFQDRNEDSLLEKKLGENLKLTPEDANRKRIPRIVVTQPTPQKSPMKINITQKRNIVSPIAQYVKGKGVVEGRKIIFKEV